jgi:hypothetical protein
MMLLSGLFQFLKQQPSLASMSIYRYVIPQNAPLPAMTLALIDGQRIHSHNGASGLAETRIQISCWSEDNDEEAEQIGDSVRLVLDGYKGHWGNISIDNSSLDQHRTIYEDDAGVYQVILEFLVWYHEATM